MYRKVIYVASTAILVLEILAGGIMDLAHFNYVLEEVRGLGYPPYLLYIVGGWKVLAAAALLWPRVPRLREWAYAGVFFEMSGAVASHVFVGDAAGKLAAPLAFTLVTLVSWCFWADRGALWRGAAGGRDAAGTAG